MLVCLRLDVCNNLLKTEKPNANLSQCWYRSLRCQNLNYEFLGLHFGTLREHFGIIWQLLGLPGGPLGAFWRRGRILRHLPPRILVHFGTPLAPKNSKGTNKLKKQCPKSIVENMCSQSPCKMAESVISIVDTICFERSDIIHLGGFWSPFGSLLESILGTFCKKQRFEASKNTHLKQTSKFYEKRSCEQGG